MSVILSSIWRKVIKNMISSLCKNLNSCNGKKLEKGTILCGRDCMWPWVRFWRACGLLSMWPCAHVALCPCGLASMWPCDCMALCPCGLVTAWPCVHVAFWHVALWHLALCHVALCLWYKDWLVFFHDTSAVQCSAVQCSAVQCSAVQCSAVVVVFY